MLWEVHGRFRVEDGYCALLTFTRSAGLGEGRPTAIVSVKPPRVSSTVGWKLGLRYGRHQSAATMSCRHGITHMRYRIVLEAWLFHVYSDTSSNNVLVEGPRLETSCLAA